MNAVEFGGEGLTEVTSPAMKGDIQSLVPGAYGLVSRPWTSPKIVMNPFEPTGILSVASPKVVKLSSVESDRAKATLRNPAALLEPTIFNTCPLRIGTPLSL